MIDDYYEEQRVQLEKNRASHERYNEKVRARRAVQKLHDDLVRFTEVESMARDTWRDEEGNFCPLGLVLVGVGKFTTEELNEELDRIDNGVIEDAYLFNVLSRRYKIDERNLRLFCGTYDETGNIEAAIEEVKDNLGIGEPL